LLLYLAFPADFTMVFRPGLMMESIEKYHPTITLRIWHIGRCDKQAFGAISGEAATRSMASDRRLSRYRAESQPYRKSLDNQLLRD
jgi:hypothetical protein